MGKSWTVFCVQQLTRPIASLPPDVSNLFNIHKGEAKKGRGHPSRQIAFLDSGEQVLRVISLRQSPRLFAEVMTTARGVAVATVAPQLSYQVPQAVLQHLGYAVRPARNELLLAWTMPTSEFARYRRAIKKGESSQGEAHVYLSRAEFVDLHRSKSRVPESVLDRDQVEAAAAADAK